MPYDAEILVVGCGNILFKDDGFGPEVIKGLEEYFKDREKPDNVMFIDAGTGGPHFVFSLPHEQWKKMIVVDVVEFNAEPGTLRKFDVTEIPKGSYENMHTWPVSQPLHELSERIDVVVIGCKPGEVSAPNVEMGLTPPVKEAVPRAIQMILKEIGVSK
ncbi:coenzyme F420-reducing hydrogenase, FrhD protein [Methanothermobacter wolfeii]|uniref:Coenzyme F420-reducing hydrogenase, FrhD protein n=1 Tax=Methanothermobacter wolfeii TaxID=145261 RepID=A0A9E7RTX5_METWO|nr:MULTISPECIES: coenzyme F420-reducing hydrogenase, FrhD protein [Methanothermobacter]MDI6818319.1 coenzyme F420-reducing hydrogenase, FrhD protein [Methanothermobacter thermautotrophicus]MDI6702576.1 coenzyme F420-reducing hydrogenase, FrhD protein [Methanothermobacter wolfeii]MDI6841793.1 coenzyme F420-reducing hydrogenase, FrhD protein [Methanothermobacter wolfeii]NLM02213.1 coenzyme F420-reducing hydrogenase, FrhD protein [Methanothermobacter wolfeii]QHN07009.1 coenzyme F420-reducing hydr